MFIKKYDLGALILALVIVALVLGAIISPKPRIDATGTALPKQAPTSTVKAVDTEYHIEGLCAIVDELDILDSESEYGLTNAIINAGGAEDTLNVALEACDELEGK